jgi:hypothetical protein
MKYIILILLFAACKTHDRCDERLYIERWQEASERLNNFRRDSNAMKAALAEMRQDTCFVMVGQIRFALKKMPTEAQWRNDSIIITPALAP